MKIPKVLVICANPFSDINNNGKTLKSIFSAFPKECLAELYFRPQDNIIGDGEYASTYYAFSDLDIIRSIVHFSSKCGGVQSFERAKCERVAQDKTYQKFLHGRLKNIKWIRSILWKTRKWDTKEYRNWYKNFKPDIIFALLGGPGVSYTIAQEISQELKKPLAIYFTDDYLIRPIRKGLLSQIRYHSSVNSYKKIVDKSAICFCIGEMMCQEYTEFFGKMFFPIMNAVPISPLKTPVESRPLTLSYFGGLNLNRWKMLCRLATFIGENSILYVYSGAEITLEMEYEFKKHNNVQLCGCLHGEQVKEQMMQSDVLVHIESDDIVNRSMTALSISTKIPEYMSCGRMILGYGPSELASMKMIESSNAGIVISSESSNDIVSAQYQNILNTEYRRKCGQNGYLYAKSHFDINVVANDLLFKLSSLS